MPPRIELAEANKNKDIKTFDDAQRADVNDVRFAKVRRQMTKFADLIGDGSERPSIQKAERYRYLTCPHERIEVTDEEEKEMSRKEKDDLEIGRDKTRTRIKKFKYQEYDFFEFEDFGQFGKKMMILFFILSLCYIPSILIYASGSALTNQASSTGFLEAVTMGNVNQNNSELLNFWFTTNPQTKTDTGDFVAFMDFASTTLIIIFLIFHARREGQLAQELSDSTITVGDYTLRVSNLPQSLPAEVLRFKLRDFFEEKGYEVYDIVVCESNGDQLDLIGNLGRVYNEYDSLRAKYPGKDVSEFYQDDIDHFHDIQSKINELRKEIKAWGIEHEKKNVSAFVTLERAEEVEDVIAMFRKTFYEKIVNFVMIQEDHDVYMEEVAEDGIGTQKYYLKVERAEEPSNVLYSNLKYSRNGRLIRRLGTFCAMLAVMSVSFVCIAYAMYYQSLIPSTDCKVSGITKAQAEADSSLVGCYCQGLGTRITDDQTFCAEWIFVFVRARLLLLTSAFCVVVLNYALKNIVNWLVIRERHFTLSHEQSAISNKLFLCLFTNTSLIILVLNANIRSFIPDFPTAGTYSEFTEKWFSGIGVQLCLTLIFNMVSPQIVPFLILKPIQNIRIWLNAERIENEGSQLELNELYAGGKFLLAERYAALLNTFFTVLFYCSGLPILVIMGFVTFCTTYLFDKYSLLRFYSNPPQFSYNIASNAAQLMPAAIALHLLIATFMYGGPIWSLSIDSINPFLGSNASLLETWEKQYNFANAIFHSNSLPLFMYLVVLVGLRLLYYLKDFSPITLKVEVDFLKVETFQKKLPRSHCRY